MKPISLRWIGVTLAVAMLAVALSLVALCVPPSAVAKAEGDYTLVLTDGNVPCAPGDKENAYCYEYNATKKLYTFTYHSGLSIKPVALTDGENRITDVSWTYDPIVSVKRDENGKLTTYSVRGRINGTTDNYTFTVQVVPRTLSVSWEEDSLKSEYGQVVAPVANLPSDVPDELTYVVAVSGDAFDTEYVRQQGSGSYTIRPALPADSNYALSEDGLTASYKVSAYSGSIAVAREGATVNYNGTRINMVDLLGVTAEEGYEFYGKFSIDGSTWTTDKLLPDAAGTYSVFFVFDGAQRNYQNPQTATFTITVNPSDVVMSALEGALSVAYQRDRTQAQYAEAVYAQLGKAYAVTDTDGHDVNCSPADFTYTYQLVSGGEWGATPPDTVGDYRIRIHFSGNGNYNACSDEVDLQLPFAVSKGVVSVRWIVYPATLQYGEHFDMSSFYRIDSVEFNEWAENGNQVEYSLTYEYSADNVNWQPYAPGEDAPMPGDYRAKAVMDSALYCGTSEWAPIRVQKVVLSEEDITFAATSFVYGQTVDLQPDLREGLSLRGGTWNVRYLAEDQADVLFVAVGNYDVHLTLEDDAMYTCDLTFASLLGITPKPVALNVWDVYVTYGDRAFASGVTYGLENNGLVWWRDGSVLTGDVADFLNNLSVDVRSPSGAWVSQIDNSFVVGEGYQIRVNSANTNYDISIVGEAKLYVRARALRVRVNGTLNLFEGAQPRLSVEIENYVTEDDYAALMPCFALVYEDEDGTVYDEAPMAVGTYTVKLQQTRAPVLSNYSVQFVTVKLVIGSLSLPTTLREFAVSGRFEGKDTLTVEKVNGSRYSAAASSVLKGYHVVSAYEISNPASTGTGQITFSLTIPDNTRSPKVLYLEGDRWVEVPVTQSGNVLTFTQHTMSSKYLVCARRSINWLLIGLIAGGVVLVAVGIIVAIMVPRLRRQKKLAADATQQVAAPTAKATAAPDEEEELDSFIESFDESTVQRELTPAERIALREREEKYQQYKARLERLRTSDRTMQDTLRSLGVSSNADDDEIIARMMAADEERARRLEEDLRREEEEAKQRQEEEVRTVILERSDEVLEQRTFAPTVTDSDDDDDIDI